MECNCCYKLEPKINECKYGHFVCNECKDKISQKTCIYCNPCNQIYEIKEKSIFDNHLLVTITICTLIIFYFIFCAILYNLYLFLINYFFYEYKKLIININIYNSIIGFIYNIFLVSFTCLMIEFYDKF